MNIILSALCGLVLIMTAGCTPVPVAVSIDETMHDESEMTQREFIEAKIIEYFPNNTREMLAIASCESRGFVHREADGRLIKNPKSSASGVFQVLLYTHRPDYERMGLDMQNIDDYMRFVQHLRRTQGRSPWFPSQDCWREKI